MNVILILRNRNYLPLSPAIVQITLNSSNPILRLIIFCIIDNYRILLVFILEITASSMLVYISTGTTTLAKSLYIILGLPLAIINTFQHS